MTKDKHSLSWIFVSRMIGIICFLIVVVLAKILELFLSPNSIYQKVIEGILFANFWLLLLIAIILFVADIFGAFPFPLNLPSPIIRAFGSVFCIAFILIVFQWIDANFNTMLFQLFWIPSLIVIPLLFIIILISGYYEILCDLWSRSKLDSGGVSVPAASADMPAVTTGSEKSWDEISAEFRMMLYDIIHRFRQEIRK